MMYRSSTDSTFIYDEPLTVSFVLIVTGIKSVRYLNVTNNDVGAKPTKRKRNENEKKAHKNVSVDQK